MATMANDSFETIVNNNRLIQSSSLTIRLQYIQQINNEIINNNSNNNNNNSNDNNDNIEKDNMNNNNNNNNNNMIELKLKPGLVKKISRIIINCFLDNQYNESKFINELKLYIQLSVNIYSHYDVMIEFYVTYLQEILNNEFKKNIYLLSSSSSNQERLIDLCCMLINIYCDAIITSTKQIHNYNATNTLIENDDTEVNTNSNIINGDNHDADTSAIDELVIPSYIQSLLVIIGEQFEKLSETLSTDIDTPSGKKGDIKNDDKYENKYYRHAKYHINSAFNHFKSLRSLYVLASQLWMNLPITITTITPISPISSTTKSSSITSTVIDQTPMIAININSNAYKQSQKTAISSLLLQYFKDHHHNQQHLDPLYIQLKSIVLSTYKQRVMNLSKQQASILSQPCWNLFIKLLTTEDWSATIAAAPTTSTIAITTTTTATTFIANTISDNYSENLETIFQKTIKKAPESFSTVLLRFFSALNPSINISNYIRSIGIMTIIKLLKSSDDNIRYIALNLVQLICNRFVIDIDCYQQLLQQLCEGYLGKFDFILTG